MTRIIVVALLVSSLICGATTRTIGTGGDHSTIQAAVNVAVAGDVLSVIEAKTYSEQVTLASSGSSGNPITLRNDSGGTVLIRTTSASGSSFCLNTSSRQWWVIQDISVEHAGSGSGVRCIGSDSGSTGNLVFTRVTATGSGGANNSNNCFGFRFVPGASSLTFNDCAINVTSDATCVGWDGMQMLGVSNVTIDGMHVYADDPTKRDDGIVLSGTTLSVTDSLIEDGWSSNTVAFHPDGIVIQAQDDGSATTGVTIARNEIINFDQCIYPDAIHGNISGLLIVNNLLRQRAGYGGGSNVNGINVDGDTPNTNKIDCTVANNTIDVRGFSMRVGRVNNDPTSNTQTIRNNLYINPGNTGTYIDDTEGVSLNYNLYDSAGASTVANWGGSNKTFAQLQAVPQEANGARTTPGIIGSGNYRASSGSSAIVSAGVNLTSTFTTDITGATRPASSAWTIGAYEYNTGTANAGSARGGTFKQGGTATSK